MKKLVSLCLLFALVCSLCVTSVSAAAVSPEELYEKYAPILDALEAEDYDAALEAIEALVPVPEYEPVEITTENFYDYFEITTSEPRSYTNPDGRQTIQPGYLMVSPKEGVSERLNRDGSTLTIGVKAKKDLYRAKVDFETGTVTLGDKMKSDTKKEMKKSATWFESKVDTQIDVFYEMNGRTLYSSVLASDFFMFKNTEYKYWTNGPAEAGSKAKYYQVVYTDIELVNATGTIYIAK